LKAKANKAIDEEKKILHNLVSVLHEQRRKKRAVWERLECFETVPVWRMFFNN
jgi:hypothetical protein